ncbi:hypothetical protein HUT16_27190 [Kitasatospora sp. NA04385]|uniref:hypothetical protein n=1 Tax=Kitasatospora sp. NA04385 TaxID=2742135 RepID=UPI001592224B|nr:hypothetical protein [Kitasatospora sp. NA04385]QKW22265.1 hypothetical protein HUT16_27190 [Kitasatospora sp. NA04385]
MNDDSTPPGEPPEDSGSTSFSESARNWYQRHKPKIRIALGVALTVGVGVVAALATQRPEGQEGETYEAENIEGLAPVPNHDTTGAFRQSALDPDRDPFLRRLPPGQHASEAAKARYRELTGNELPPGYTVVRRWLFLDSEDEGPDEAAA